MTPPPPGQQATAERHLALDPLRLVFPLDQSDPALGDAVVERGWGALPTNHLRRTA